MKNKSISIIKVHGKMDTTELTTEESANKIIEIISKNDEKVLYVDFSGIELINTAFLKPFVHFIMNEKTTRVIVKGLSADQKELFREALISEKMKVNRMNGNIKLQNKELLTTDDSIESIINNETKIEPLESLRYAESDAYNTLELYRRIKKENLTNSINKVREQLDNCDDENLRRKLIRKLMVLKIEFDKT